MEQTNLNDLFIKHMGLIHAVARRFARRGTDYEDLFQIGALGLMRAIRNYTPEQGYAFSTYAVPVIAGELRSYLRENTRVKLSHKIYKNAALLKAAQGVLGENAPLLALAQKAGISEEDAAVAFCALETPRSLDENPKSEPYDMEADTEFSGLLDRMCVETGLKALNLEDRRLIELRYYHRLSQEKTGRLLGLSQVQVSRAEKRILRFLKTKLAG